MFLYCAPEVTYTCAVFSFPSPAVMSLVWARLWEMSRTRYVLVRKYFDKPQVITVYWRDTISTGLGRYPGKPEFLWGFLFVTALVPSVIAIIFFTFKSQGAYQKSELACQADASWKWNRLFARVLPGTFFRLQVNERVGISFVEVY